MFNTFQGDNNQWYFHLKARNGRIILQSEGYLERRKCLMGVESVMVNGANKKSYEINESTNSEWYFVLVATNGRVIGVSETYKSKQGCKKGIRSCIKNIKGNT